MARLREEFTVEYTYNSNAIEGNTLTLRETDMVLRGLTIDRKPLKVTWRPWGHKEAFDFVCELVKDRAPLTESIIRRYIPSPLPTKKRIAGVYRRIPRCASWVHHIFLPALLIQSEMEKLMADYAADERHIVTKLAWFHIAFEGIHPFIDGNGRTGRLLVNLEFMKAGLPLSTSSSLTGSAYYDAFDAFHVKHDLSAMEKLFARYVSERLDAYLAMLEES